MDRRTYLEGVGAAVATGTLAGCAESAPYGGNGATGDEGTEGEETDSAETTEYGILSTAVTDQPNDIGDFESLVVTIQGIWVKPDGSEETDGNDEEDDSEAGSEAGDENTTEVDDAPDTPDEDTNTSVNETQSGEAEADDEEGDDEGDTEDDGSDEEGDETSEDDADGDDDEGDSDEKTEADAGRYYIEFEEPQEADLVALQSDNAKLIDETELEVGDYRFLQLDVSDTTGVLAADGTEAEIETPGNAPLQFKQSFEIRPKVRTRFLADFTPFQIGQGRRYRIRPVASGTQVRYGDQQADSGESGTDEDAETENGTDTDNNASET